MAQEMSIEPLLSSFNPSLARSTPRSLGHRLAANVPERTWSGLDQYSCSWFVAGLSRMMEAMGRVEKHGIPEERASSVPGRANRCRCDMLACRPPGQGAVRLVDQIERFRVPARQHGQLQEEELPRDEDTLPPDSTVEARPRQGLPRDGNIDVADFREARA